MTFRWLGGVSLMALVGCTTIFPPKPIQVSFQSSPPGATVAINGDTRGRTPVAFDVSCGTPQQVTFSLVGYESYQQTIATVSQFDGRGTMRWPVEVCSSVVSATLRPIR